MSRAHVRLCAAVIGAAVLIAAPPACAQVVLDARPSSKVESGDRTTARFVLSEVDRDKDRLMITRRGDRYFWTSRDERELTHRVSGAFHYFVEASGSGYIKVFDTHALPASMRDPGPRFLYMEHVALWLGTITYWGTAEGFRPPEPRAGGK